LDLAALMTLSVKCFFGVCLFPILPLNLLIWLLLIGGSEMDTSFNPIESSLTAECGRSYEASCADYVWFCFFFICIFIVFQTQIGEFHNVEFEGGC
jgi:hypothetical protein